MQINKRLKEFRQIFFFGTTIVSLIAATGMQASAAQPSIEIGCAKKSCLSADGISLQGTKVIPGTKGSVSRPQHGSARSKTTPTPAPATTIITPFGEIPVSPEPTRSCPVRDAAIKVGIVLPFEQLCRNHKEKPPISKPTIPPQLIEIFKTLPLQKPELRIQPRKEALLAMPQIAYTPTPSQQTFHTTLFNQPITVIAYTLRYQWNWGDGITTESHDPGLPYPNQTVTHLYAKPGNYKIKLTTTIGASFIDANGIQQPIPMTTTLTSKSQPLHVKEQHAVLVSGE